MRAYAGPGRGPGGRGRRHATNNTKGGQGGAAKVGCKRACSLSCAWARGRVPQVERMRDGMHGNALFSQWDAHVMRPETGEVCTHLRVGPWPRSAGGENGRFFPKSARETAMSMQRRTLTCACCHMSFQLKLRRVAQVFCACAGCATRAAAPPNGARPVGSRARAAARAETRLQGVRTPPLGGDPNTARRHPNTDLPHTSGSVKARARFRRSGPMSS